MRIRHSVAAWIANGAVAVITCLAVPATTRADGKAFHPGVPNLSMPDQQAIITWKDGVETLVISTAIDTPATTATPDLAWVVPLPTQGKVPEIFPVERGVFDAVRAACTPRLATIHASLAPTLIALALLVWAAVLLPKHRSLIAATGITVLTLYGLINFWPSLGAARSGSGDAEPQGVSVLDARRVGAFDTVTLSSTDPAELVRWLTERGFKLTPGIEPVIAEHVAARWVFVASRLAPADELGAGGGGGGRVEPHPLGFRFATSTPIYPLRLTGVGNAALAVDLYVFADATASARKFVARRSGPVVTQSTRTSAWRPDGVVRVAQPELASIAAGSPWLTRLSATLTPRDMLRDAEIEFGPARDTGGVVHSPYSARQFGAAGAGVVLLVLSLIAAVAQVPSGAGGWRRLGWFVTAAALATSTGVALGATRDIATVRSSRDSARGVYNLLGLHENVAQALAGHRGAPRSLAELHDAAVDIHREAVAREVVSAPPREGVAPLNWRITPASNPPGTFVYEYRDIYGAPERTPIR